MRFARVAGAVACLLAAGSLALGCGGSDSDSSTTAEVRDLPAPPKSDFPPANGRSLAEVLDLADGPAELALAPAAQVFNPGPNRYSFGVFELDRTQIPDAKVALYFAKVPRDEQTALPPAAGKPGEITGSGGGRQSKPPPPAAAEALDQPAVGPFTAAVQSLETQPAFRAQTTSNDPDSALAVYVTEIDFPSQGEWRIAALVDQGGEVTAQLLPSAIVGQYASVPAVGDRPPRIHTPTAADAGGDLSQIDTRIPPDTQHQADFFDVLGEKPIALLFATPQFCQSRVCGPVVDVAEQVKETYGDEVEFIHMEIFNDNDPGKGVRPQVRAFNLPSEPWLFVIDAQGVIRTAIEGAFGLDEMERAVQGVSGT